MERGKQEGRKESGERNKLSRSIDYSVLLFALSLFHSTFLVARLEGLFGEKLRIFSETFLFSGACRCFRAIPNLHHGNREQR